MKNFSLIIRVSFFVFLPAFIAYLSTDYSILDYWQEQEYLGSKLNLVLLKQCLLFISVVISTAYLALTNESLKKEKQIALSQRAALINQLKTSTLYYLESLINDKYVTTLEIRAWSEKKNFLYKIKKSFCQHFLKKPCPRSFCELAIAGLTDNPSSDLYFIVEPERQGLLGVCYQKGEIVYEEDFSLVLASYQLNSFQLNRLRSIKFYLCAPIYDSNNKIVAIISFESIYSIEVKSENEREIANAITNFCQMFYRNCPELFY